MKHPGRRHFLPVFAALCLTYFSCSYVFWRPGSEIAGVDWLDNESVIEFTLEYDERDSPAVAAGTTQKRNLRTTARVLGVKGTTIVKTPLQGTAPGSLVGHAYNFGGSPAFLLTEGAGRDQKTWLVRLTKSGIEKIGGMKGENTLQFIPSPDRRKAVLLIDQEWGGRFLVFTRNDFSQEIRCGARSRTEPASGDSYVWSGDSKQLFILRQGNVLAWDGCGMPAKAAVFPRCFSPSTLYEGPVAEDGREYVRDAPESAPRIEKREKRGAFGSGPMISDVRRIGENCP